MREAFQPLDEYEIANWKIIYETCGARELRERAFSDIARGEAADGEAMHMYYARSAALSGLAILRTMEDESHNPANTRRIRRMKDANYRRVHREDDDDF